MGLSNYKYSDLREFWVPRLGSWVLFDNFDVSDSGATILVCFFNGGFL